MSEGNFAMPRDWRALFADTGAELSCAEAIRARHARGEHDYDGPLPDAVLSPTSIEQVRHAAEICRNARIPIIPFGAGTSIEGGVTAPAGGLCLDLSRMNRILAVRPEDQDATVEAGVTRLQLNAHLRDSGYFFPVDPGADATLGGMAATRASGTNAVRYGTMRENVISTTIVTGDAQIVRTAGRARKSSAGYDLTRLIVGSEGTLGIIVDLTVRLHPIPEALSVARCCFADLRAAVECVTMLVQLGISASRIEFLDEIAIGACNRDSGLDLPERITLFIELAGTPHSVQAETTLVARVAADNEAEEIHWASDPDGCRALWRARHAAYHSCLRLMPGSPAFSSDVCVPISSLPECVAETRRDIDRSGLLATIAGHVGDGNFHVLFLPDPKEAGQVTAARGIYDRLVSRAIAMDGTCSGEHGIGTSKRLKLIEEHGEGGVAMMRAIKGALDPHDILNPGKLLP
ncbi:FAD-binding oxidoreductase [Rhizorhabdus wittichii]|uniref:FAD-binding oxidoreductase n=1 Tax=Rhizorhabdus wittichii TaxID=160791 RepID=UPI001ABFC164|nr:FAD-linked oxidase C-terminal domain-containing protein [Rhizorhabdus wittichii]